MLCYPPPSGPPISPGEFIVAELKKRNWTITELARRAEVHNSNLFAAISGRISLSDNVAVKISVAMTLAPEAVLVIEAKHKAFTILKAMYNQEVSGRGELPHHPDDPAVHEL